MNKFKILSRIFLALAVLLSDIMCAVTAYSYCDMLWGIKYLLYSAPASVAFLLLIPYSAAIALCLALAWFFRRKAKNSHFTA